MKTNQKIADLLQDFESANPELGKLIRAIRKSARQIASTAEEQIMYGGIVYKITGRLFCGLFLRKKHISVEFDLGYLLNDPGRHLEGAGKYRRHLKIHNKNEIQTKQVAAYIKESFNLKA